MAKEKNFENGVKKFLKNQNCYLLKYWGGGIYTKSGIPDLLICCEGLFIGVEIKAEDGEPSDLQLYNLQKIEYAGGYSWLLYPEDFDTFKCFIISLKKHDYISANKLYKRNRRWARVQKCKECEHYEKKHKRCDITYESVHVITDCTKYKKKEDKENGDTL